MTKKAQVQACIDMGLTLKQAQKNLKKIAKGTVSSYYSTLKRQPQNRTPKVTPEMMLDASAEAYELGVNTAIETSLTKENIIGKIIESDLLPSQKKVFVMFTVNSL